MGFSLGVRHFSNFDIWLLGAFSWYGRHPSSMVTNASHVPPSLMLPRDFLSNIPEFSLTTWLSTLIHSSNILFSCILHGNLTREIIKIIFYPPLLFGFLMNSSMSLTTWKNSERGSDDMRETPKKKKPNPSQSTEETISERIAESKEKFLPASNLP